MSTTGVSVTRGFVQTSHGQVHYRTAGDGPPLLILHPNTYSSGLFAEVVPLLGARFTVFALDRLGHGMSDPIPESFRFIQEHDQTGDKGPTYPYDEFVDVVVDVLDALGIERTNIVGQHTGAHLGLEMAVLHPERVEKLVLVSSTDWEDEEKRVEVWKGVKVAHRSPNMDGSHLMEEWRGKRDWASPSSTPQIMNKVVMMALQARRPWPTLPSEVIRCYHSSARFPLVKAPTLIMAGEHDYAGRFTHHQRTLLPKDTPSESAMVEGVGAYFALEKPQEFTRRVLDFLAKET